MCLHGYVSQQNYILAHKCILTVIQIMSIITVGTNVCLDKCANSKCDKVSV